MDIRREYLDAECGWSEPVKVLGLTLRPLTLRHHLILTSILEADDQDPGSLIESMTELTIAAFVCALPGRKVISNLRSLWFGPFMRFWLWRIRKLDLREEAMKFAKYREQQYALGTTFRPKGGKEVAGPWECRLKLFLMSKLGLTEEQALDRPIRLSIIEEAVMAEAEGRIECMSKADDELFRIARSMPASQEVQE